MFDSLLYMVYKTRKKLIYCYFFYSLDKIIIFEPL
nr:MAG TPA: hypothetical protein [Caudoviricetes sp.]